jgi:hypothetical protein
MGDKTILESVCRYVQIQAVVDISDANSSCCINEWIGVCIEFTQFYYLDINNILADGL